MIHSTLKKFLTTDISSKQIVYERCYPKSLPQHRRDSYFLTELYNVKRLIQRQGFIESDFFNGCATKGKLQLHKNELEPYYKATDGDKTLVFESRFESGNLCLAIKASDNEYNLFMQNDVNTQGHTQWFFFRVENTNAHTSIKFNIMNFVFFIHANSILV